MAHKITLDEKDYEVDALSDEAKKNLEALKFITDRLQEYSKMLVLLQQTKISYIDSIKQEMMAEKAGLLFED